MEEKEIYLLITRYLSTQTSTEENERLADWITASEENEQAFEAIKVAWKNVKTPDRRPAEEALSRLKERIRVEEQEASVPVRRLFSSPRIIAAASVLLVLSAALWYTFRSPGPGSDSYLQQVTMAGEMKNVTLSDGTKICLAPKSQLKYPASFDQEKRTVELIGEAYFEVSKNPHRPFIVHTADLDVQVLGTHFNVNAGKNQNLTTVSLLEGRVIVNISDDQSNDEFVLKPGQELTLHRSSKQVFQHELDSVAVLGWMTKTLIFSNDKLSDAALKIEKMYGVKLVLENQETADTRLYAQFENDSLKDVLDIICSTGNLSYRNHQNKIYISLKK